MRPIILAPIALLFCIALVLVLVFETAQKDGCSLDRTEFHPEDVIGPCSASLDDKSLSGAGRATILSIRGRAYHRTKRIDLAIADYGRALQLTPDNSEILVSRSNAFLRQGRWQEYVRDVARASEIDTTSPRVLTAVGTLNRNSGRWEQAVEFYSRALKAAPADAFALESRMEIYWQMHDYPKAIADADAAVRVTEEAAKTKPLSYLDEDGNIRDFYVVALTKRAGLLEDAGQLERAEKDHDDAVARDRSGLALMRRGEFYMTAPGKEDVAIADLRESLAREANNAPAHYTLAIILMRQKKYSQALAEFDRAIGSRPNYAIALLMRAKVYRELGHTDDAVRDFLSAVAANPSIMPQTMPALRTAGYWMSRENPDQMTPALADAIRACMLDVQCN
jgi:tetratricopeptide (TPR) repeat protein